MRVFCLRLETHGPHSWREIVASGHRLLRANFLRNAVSAYTTHIIPDDKSIPSSASLAYRDGAMPNFAFWAFCELRHNGVLRSSCVRPRTRTVYYCEHPSC